MKQHLLTSILFTFSLSLFCFNVFSQQIVIDFTNPVPGLPNSCDQTWSEEGLELFVSDYDGSGCNFSYPGDGNIILSPAALTVDLFGIGNVTSISGTTTGLCTEPCMSVSYYVGTTVVSFAILGNGTNDILFNNTQEYDLTRMAILSTEGSVQQIVINYEPYFGCEPQAEISTTGDVYVPESCHGIILTAPNGRCFRIRVENDGSLSSELTDCPESESSGK